LILWLLSILFFVCDVISFYLFWYDKTLAINRKWRLSERTLLIFCIIGGVGAFWGMRIFKHKIRKWKFVVISLLGLCLQVFCLLYFGREKVMSEMLR